MIRFEAFEAHGPTVAAFSERSDGNCSAAGVAEAEAAYAARRGVAEACGVNGDDLVRVRQVHGVNVLRADRHDRGRGGRLGSEPLGTADAIVTDVPGLPIAVLVADCVPIYLYDARRRIGGVVHAGWRGTFDDAAGQTVRFMEHEFGTDPRDVWALIGPSAGPCCYEVSEELAEQFATVGLATKRRHVDLWRSNALRLEAAGLLAPHIATSRLCTICDERFPSHRRDADGCRAMALLVL